MEKFSDTYEARRMAQLEADVDLVTRLMFGGFTGQDWDKCAERLVGYGLMVITAWVITGRIIQRCHEKGYGPLEPSSSIRNQDAADELAGETVAVALKKFRDTVLARGKWDPNKGASLRTFFIGQCLIRFPNIYRHWLTEHRARVKDRETLKVVSLEKLRQGPQGGKGSRRSGRARRRRPGRTPSRPVRAPGARRQPRSSSGEPSRGRALARRDPGRRPGHLRPDS